jgi:hypothetical protein
MNVGFDIDDTITRCPEFFGIISKALRAVGHRVYVISWREDREFAEQDLAECGISFDELVLPPQELLYAASGDWKAEAARWKSEVCRKLKVDVFFEDMPEVIRALDKGTVAFMAVDPSRGQLGYH